MSAHALMTALPMKTVERLADVEESNGTTAVSPITIGDAVEVDAELLRGNLRENRSRALPHVGRAGQHGHAAVVVQPDNRQRRRRRRRALQPERDAAAAVRAERLAPIERLGALAESPAASRHRPACRSG